MTLLAFKTYAMNQRPIIEKTSGLKGRLLTQLLVQMWKEMPQEERFEWKLLRGREKYLKKETTQFKRNMKSLLRKQENSSSWNIRLRRTDDIFNYLATPVGARVLERNHLLFVTIRNKLIEFHELGVESVSRWADAINMDIVHQNTSHSDTLRSKT